MDGSLRNLGQNAVPQKVPQPRQPNSLLAHFTFSNRQRFGQPDGAWNVDRSRAHSLLLPAAGEHGIENDSPADVQGSDPFRAVNLVSGEGKEVTGNLGEIEGDLTRRLRRVGMEGNPSFAADCSEFGD